MHTDLSAFTARCPLFPVPEGAGQGEGERARTSRSRIGLFLELSNTAVESTDPVDIKRKVRRPVMVRFRCALVEFRCFRRLCFATTDCRLAHRTHRRSSED